MTVQVVDVDAQLREAVALLKRWWGDNSPREYGGHSCPTCAVFLSGGKRHHERNCLLKKTQRFLR